MKEDYICTICNLAYNSREDRTMPRMEYIEKYIHRKRTMGVIHQECKEAYEKRLREAKVPEEDITRLLNFTINVREGNL